jgi:hypothetical protein
MRDVLSNVLLSLTAVFFGVVLLLNGIEGVRSVRSPSTGYEAVVRESTRTETTVRDDDGNESTRTTIRVVFAFDGRQQTLRAGALQAHFRRGDRAIVEVSDVTGLIVEVRDGDFTYQVRTERMSLTSGGIGVALLLLTPAGVVLAHRGRTRPRALAGDGSVPADPFVGSGPPPLPPPGEPWAATPAVLPAAPVLADPSWDRSEPVWWTAVDRRVSDRAAGIVAAVLGGLCIAGAMVLVLVMDDPTNRWVGGGVLALFGLFTASRGLPGMRSAGRLGPMSVQVEPLGYEQGGTATLQVHQPVVGPVTGQVAVTAEVVLHRLEWRTWRDGHTGSRKGGYTGKVVDRRPGTVRHRVTDGAVQAEITVPTPVLLPVEERRGHPTSSYASVSIGVRVGRAASGATFDLGLRGAPPGSSSLPGPLGYGWVAAAPIAEGTV